MDLRRGVDDAGGERRSGFDEMFARIENQQNSPVAQVGDQIRRRVARLSRQSQHGGDGGRHQIGIAEHSKVDEEHSPRESADQVTPDRHCDRRLADAAGADDGDEAGGVQLGRHLENVVIPTDHSA